MTDFARITPDEALQRDVTKNPTTALESLVAGDVASMYHAGTKRFYMVKVIQPITPEEAVGPDF